MKQRIIKRDKKPETFEWTSSMIGVIIGLIFICIILLVSNNVHANNKSNDINEVLKIMAPESGETMNSVNYETVYVGNNKFIVFKSGSDIEVIRIN